jgi:hypothetical protein
VLVRYAGSFGDDAAMRADLSVVDLPAGTVSWRVTVSPRSGAWQGLAVALSPDGTAMAVETGGTVTIHHRSGGNGVELIGDSVLAGPAAFTPDGTGLVLSTKDGHLDALDLRTGALDLARTFPAITPAPRTEEVVAWRGEDPVVVTEDRAVLLTDQTRTLVRAPAGTDELQIATTGVDLPTRTPGKPDPGPVLQRYRSTALLLDLILLCGYASTVLIVARRDRVRLRSRRR